MLTWWFPRVPPTCRGWIHCRAEVWGVTKLLVVWRSGWFGWQGEELVFRPWAPDAMLLGGLVHGLVARFFRGRLGWSSGWVEFVWWRSGQRRQFERLPTEVLCARIPDWQGANSDSICKLWFGTPECFLRSIWMHRAEHRLLHLYHWIQSVRTFQIRFDSTLVKNGNFTRRMVSIGYRVWS